MHEDRADHAEEVVRATDDRTVASASDARQWTEPQMEISEVADATRNGFNLNDDSIGFS